MIFRKFYGLNSKFKIILEKNRIRTSELKFMSVENFKNILNEIENNGEIRDVILKKLLENNHKELMLAELIFIHSSLKNQLNMKESR